jgi:ComF family protein
MLSQHHVIAHMQTLAAIALRMVFPPHCVICEAPCEDSPSVCTTCFSNITFISDPLCTICGCPFEYDMDNSEICIPCQTNAPIYDRARAALRYDAASRKLVTRLKFSDKMTIAPLAAQMMVRAGAELLDHADIIVPVPLHWRRLWVRKFNQSALIAEYISRQVASLPVLTKALVRTRHTTPQMLLSWEERQRNVQAAFQVRPRYLSHVKGKRVMLIDDVYTTGATIEACTKALKKAGASSVYVLTLARRLATDLS